MPCGDRNSRSSSMNFRILRNWFWSAMDSSLRSPIPSVRMQAKFAVRSARLSMNHSRRFLQSGSFSRTSGSKASTRNNASQPPISRIFAAYRPGKVHHQLMDATLQKCAITLAFALMANLVNTPRRPGMYGRIDIAERPLVGGDLSVGMHVPLAQHQRELLLGEVRIHECERNAVKREVPSGLPRVFPLVRHGDNVRGIQWGPV